MTDTPSSDAPLLVDLRTLEPDARAALLTAFDEALYRPAFPDDDVREDPSVWLALMAQDPGPPAPIVAPILALGAGGQVLGAVVVERYRTAGAGFLTYLLVAPWARRGGLARRLLETALEVLASESEGPRPVLFAEAERPELVTEPGEHARAVERLSILSALGARRARLDYVQPPLAPGRAAHRLHLLAAAQSLPPSGRAPASLVIGFLDELYRSLGSDPTSDPDFAAMRTALEESDEVTFDPLT